MRLLATFIISVGLGVGHAAEAPKETISRDVLPSPITRDITAIAWVRGDVVQLPSGASQELVDGLTSKFIECPLTTNRWRQGTRDKINSDTDRQYANAFLIKNSANRAPPNTITPTTEITTREFRLLNRVKAEIRESGGKAASVRFIHSDIPEIGDTSDPCVGWVPFAGQPHPNNGTKDISASGGVFQLNEGRIGEGGQAVDRTLNACSQLDCIDVPIGPTTPWIWSVVRFDAEGNLSPLDHQIFPTYSLYENGQLRTIFPQSAPEPFISLDASSQRLQGEVP